MWRSKGLQVRLAALVLAAVLPLGVLSIWFATHEASKDKQGVGGQLKFAAALVAAAQDQSIDGAEHLLVAIASTEQFRPTDRAACERYFDSLRDRYPTYAGLGFADTNGEIQCSTSGRARALNIRDRDYFQAALERRSFAMGGPVVGRQSGRLVIPFALPVLDAGSVVGVVFATLDLERAASALARIELPPSARVSVVDRRGQELMTSPARPGSDRRVMSASVVDDAFRRKVGLDQFSDAAGQPRLYGFAMARQVGSEALLAIVSVSRADIDDAAAAALRAEILVIALGLLVAATGAWVIGGRMFVQPARRILETVQRLERGELDARVPLPSSTNRGDFGRIGGAFNLMAQSLQLRQHALENELARNRGAYEMLDQVVSSMPEALIAMDVHGRILMNNQAAEQMFPLAAHATTSTRAQVWGLYYPDGTTPYRPADVPLARGLRGESGGQVPIFVRNALVPQGRMLQASFQPIRGPQGIAGALVVCTDVTELRERERDLYELNAGLEARIAERTAELTRQETLYRTLAEQAPEVVWNTDATGTRLTFLNHAWYALVGGTPQEWLGRSGIGAIHPDDRAAVSANWLNSQVTLTPFSGVRRLRAIDGTYHTMSYHGTPVLDDNGEVAFWVGIDSDITDLKTIERALRVSNQELEAFSYSISHDLRAPLGVIAGFGKALETKLGSQLDERSRHYLTRIQAGVQKMEELIEALLALARVARAPLGLSTVNLTALAHEVADELQALQPERSVEIVVEEGMVAQGDARLLRIVLQNLMGNAWKFTARQAHARVVIGKEGDVFFVRDNGVGFDATYADKLFVPFQRLHTEKEFPGTGIGLATVRRIVSRHQGRVWAQSPGDEGATVYFTLSGAALPAWASQDSV